MQTEIAPFRPAGTDTPLITRGPLRPFSQSTLKAMGDDQPLRSDGNGTHMCADPLGTVDPPRAPFDRKRCPPVSGRNSTPLKRGRTFRLPWVA